MGIYRRKHFRFIIKGNRLFVQTHLQTFSLWVYKNRDQVYLNKLLEDIQRGKVKDWNELFGKFYRPVNSERVIEMTVVNNERLQ